MDTNKTEPTDAQVQAAVDAMLADGWALDRDELTETMRKVLTAAHGVQGGHAPQPSDTALLDFLREETLDLRCFNQPTGGDDYDVRWRVIQHHGDKPHEREVGESFSDDPRDAIRDAMQRLSAPGVGGNHGR